MILTIMNRLFQLRLTSTSGNSEYNIRRFARYLSSQYRAHPFCDAYVPKFDPNMMIFKFESEKDRDTIKESLSQQDLTRWHLKLHVSTPSESLERSLRTVFVWNLNSIFFATYSNRTGYDAYREPPQPRTIHQRKVELVSEIMTTIKGIHEVSFLYHKTNTPPKCLKLIFKEEKFAKANLNEDTYLTNGFLSKRFKKIDQHIPISLCKVCRMSTHRTGDSRCDLKPRCPRCLKDDHTKPLTDPRQCRPSCHNCRTVNENPEHSTGSDKCPKNIAYKKEERKKLNQQKYREERLKKTPIEHQAYHADLLDIKETYKPNGPSFARVVNPSKPTPAPAIFPKDFSPPGFSHAFVTCAIFEKYKPGAFQPTMDSFCQLNGWPSIKYPPIIPEVLDAITNRPPRLPSKHRRSTSTDSSSSSSRSRSSRSTSSSTSLEQDIASTIGDSPAPGTTPARIAAARSPYRAPRNNTSDQ